jgi:hypothetical protein
MYRDSGKRFDTSRVSPRIGHVVRASLEKQLKGSEMNMKLLIGADDHVLKSRNQLFSQTASVLTSVFLYLLFKYFVQPDVSTWCCCLLKTSDNGAN